MPLERPCSLNFAGLEKLLVIGKISFVSSKYVSQAVHRYNDKNELWKPLRLTRFQNHHCEPFQSSLSLSIRVSFCICFVTCVYQFVSFFEKLRICILFATHNTITFIKRYKKCTKKWQGCLKETINGLY